MLSWFALSSGSMAVVVIPGSRRISRKFPVLDIPKLRMSTRPSSSLSTSIVLLLLLIHAYLFIYFSSSFVNFCFVCFEWDICCWSFWLVFYCKENNGFLKKCFNPPTPLSGVEWRGMERSQNNTNIKPRPTPTLPPIGSYVLYFGTSRGLWILSFIMTTLPH